MQGVLTLNILILINNCKGGPIKMLRTPRIIPENFIVLIPIVNFNNKIIEILKVL